MKMKWFYGVLLIFLLSGCQYGSTEDGRVDYLTDEGVIVAIEDGRFLLVNGVSEEDIETLEPLEIVIKHNDGAWFTYENLDELKVNMEVRVSYDGMEDSLPGYGNAIDVEILENPE